MKKYILLIIVGLSFVQTTKSQHSFFLEKEDIVGRWVESKRVEGDSVKVISEYADTYIFKDNGLFHKGEAAEGVIVFNITGKYTVDGNSVEVLYKDYIQRRATAQPAKKITFKVLSCAKDEMTVLVQDYDFEYKMILKK